MTDADHGKFGAQNAQRKTVTLSGRDLEDARRLFRILSDEEPPSAGSELPRVLHERIQRDGERLVRKARDLLELRRRRAKRFGRAMFNEPAWEMLLSLYAVGGARLTIGRLVQLSGVSKATALRWMDYLAGQKLVRREPHPTDARSAFIMLTEKGEAALAAFLNEVLGLDI